MNLTFADEGFDVVAVGDGDAAVREIAASQPDIVLADVHMPGPSGYEICSLLRGIDETADTPVILLVGAFEQFDPDEAERAGADAFVTKPFQSIRELVDQVKVLLARKAELPAVVAPATDNIVEPAPAEKDTRDIDSLYERSFAETVEMPSGGSGSADLTSFPMGNLDDEIIETVYSSEVSEESNKQVGNHDPHFAGSFEPVNGFEPGSIAATPAAEEADPSPFEETLQMDAPPHFTPDENTAAMAHTAPTEELRRDPFATTTDAFDLDDLDLLDLSTAEIDEQFSFGTPTQSVEDGSHKQVVSISPELLDIIVTKVVEKLSEKY